MIEHAMTYPYHHSYPQHKPGFSIVILTSYSFSLSLIIEDKCELLNRVAQNFCRHLIQEGGMEEVKTHILSNNYLPTY